MMDDVMRALPSVGLEAWQAAQHRVVGRPDVVGPSSVTVVAYHFWDAARQDAQFRRLECALRETWLWCGMLRTVLVVNRVTSGLEMFAEASGGWVSFAECKELVPGDLFSMSADCMGRLAGRFDTEHVLIVQNDGFPIRSGLEAFLGTYDYWGAPWIAGREDRVTRMLLHHGYDVGNGGFSLRSRKLCELGAWYYHRKYKLIPDCYLVTEDFYFCKTLPSFEKKYRETIRIPSAETAATFSLEANETLYEAVHASPFGFHGLSAFARLARDGRIPNAGNGQVSPEPDRAKSIPDVK
jgi:hypothetical protein